MKDIKLYGLLACLCLLMQSCLFSEDDMFDSSSAQRAMASVEECQAMLQSAPNGWLLEYYPGQKGESGGYSLIAKFDGEKVEMVSEMATGNYNIGEVCTSLYKVNSFQGTELSFDSYNELIHMFCEPNSYTDPGYQGDYEFIFRSVSKEEILLTGKKHGVTLTMTPMPENVTWQTYLNSIAQVKNAAPYLTYKLKIGGTEVVTMLRSEHALTTTKVDDRGQATTTYYPFIYTAEGIRMLEPLEMNGVAMSEFRWNNDNRSFICTDEGVDAVVEFYSPADYPKYIGNYVMTYGSTRINATISQKVEGASYTLTGLPAFNLELTYNYNTNCFDVLFQYLGIYGGYYIYLCPWDATAGYLTWAVGSGLNGFIVSEDGQPLTIRFKDNGVYGSADSLLFWRFTGAPGSSTSSGGILQIPTPVLQKIDN
ncbi:DUF4302 domain-containing protein [Bacteroides sp.]|uniref:DUF4302 domain-containing protein n=1 Tax=Bacteroides sp. TaxID=29523 RepID=UPI0025C01296|nr:DUF4302 domain-containing protein [Bacteroides sp.]